MAENGVDFRPFDKATSGIGQLTTLAGATFGPILNGDFVEEVLFEDDFDPTPVEGWFPDGGEFGDGDPAQGDTTVERSWEYGAPSAAPVSPNGGNVFAAKLDGFSETEWTESWLRTPVLDLRGVHNATLSFQEYLSLDPLGETGNPDEEHEHWQWAEVSIRDADNDFEVLQELTLRWGVDTEWSSQEFELTEASLGKRVVVEFALVVDHLGAAEGWFLDEIRVTTFDPAHAIGGYALDAATIHGGWAVEYDPAEIDRVTVGGALDITGATANFLGAGELTANALIFASYGSLEGTFSSVENVPAGYTVDYAYQGNNIALVSENGVPETPYETWAIGFELNRSTDGAPEADANGDGIKNLAKFAMGQSPVEFTEAPEASLQGEYLELAYTRDSSVAGEVEIVAQAASELTGTWSTDGVEDNHVETIEGIEHRVARVPADGGRQFLRLEFTAL